MSGFDVDLVTQLFKDAIQGELLLLSTYSKAYMEFMKLFASLGTVFKFVVSDVTEKTEILGKYYEEQPDNYSSLQSMIAFESENNLLTSKSRPSGCRTLLRLHRALDFIRTLMKGIGEASNDQKMGALASQCYHETLAHYHIWLVRQAVTLGVRTLPTRHALLLLIKPPSNDVDYQMADQVLDEETICSKIDTLVSCINPVYEITQQLYEKHNLLDLP